MKAHDLEVTSLGECTVPSPLELSTTVGDGIGDYIPDDSRVLYDITFCRSQNPSTELSYERAGPREKIFFQPEKTKAAIVTCGGLCPGLNNVIRSVFFQLQSHYGVPEVWGIRYGYQGLNPQAGQPPMPLDGKSVEHIHKLGGTILGTSRGNQEIGVMVDFLVAQGIDILFCVGGDGTQRGAHNIAQEILRRGENISIIGIAKTIDNDITHVDRSFGYATALELALEHIAGAHNEAESVQGGIGLVKLMGRHAGFIAAGATLSSGQVNFALIPEVSFTLEGADGLLACLQRRLAARQHAVIVVAEGAGQELLGQQATEYDASGNRKLDDIGTFLKQQIETHFAKQNIPAKVKYFDPSYHIRSLRANCADAILCEQMASHAVHAAMAGKTDMLIGNRNSHFVHVPLPLVAKGCKRLEPESDIWMGVLAATQQQRWQRG